MEQSKEQKLEKTKAFLKHTSMINYNKEGSKVIVFDKIEDIILENESQEISWLNTYGLQYKEQNKKIIKQNHLDNFLNSLMSENDQRNKVIELENSIFLSLRTLHYKDNSFYTEQLFFVASPQFIWSIQEKKGDYFGEVRKRISNSKDIIRNKNAGYLLFVIIAAIIENYENVFNELNENNLTEIKLIDLNPTPEFAEIIENNKQQLFMLKKGLSSLRDAIAKIEKTSLHNYESRYFTELKEQTNYMIDDIDFDLQQLESTINLIFNLQAHKLNQIMKTLTILSVIFIPLTFLAGIYGMNFRNMPELEWKYGYFILLGIMATITAFTIMYFKKKNWF